MKETEYCSCLSLAVWLWSRFGIAPWRHEILRLRDVWQRATDQSVEREKWQMKDREERGGQNLPGQRLTSSLGITYYPHFSAQDRTLTLSQTNNYTHIKPRYMQMNIHMGHFYYALHFNGPITHISIYWMIFYILKAQIILVEWMNIVVYLNNWIIELLLNNLSMRDFLISHL